MGAPRISPTVLQARHREVGRIRMGEQVKGRDGKMRASKLKTFRLTSPSREAIEAAAAIYGGEVTRWADAPAGTGEQWQVIIQSPYLDFLILPNGFSSAFELWTGGGCVRRCDGVDEEISGGPCLCDPEARECKATSRLRGLLPMVKVVGSWRLESHGINAAVELAAFADLMAAAEMTGFHVPIRLRIEERSSQKPGQPRHDYTVPVPEIAALTPQQLLGAGVTREEVRALPAGIPEMPRAPIYPGLEREDVSPYMDAMGGMVGIEEHLKQTLITKEEAIEAIFVDGLSLDAITRLAREKEVNLAMLNAQAKLIEPSGRTLPQITDAERLGLAQRWDLL